MKYFLGIINITLWTVLGYLLLAPIKSGLAQEEPIGPLPEPKLYRLSARLDIGNKFMVAEEQKWEGIIKINRPDETRQFPFLKLAQHEYTEEIIPTQGVGIKSKRIYDRSRVKSLLPKVGIKSGATSLEGKTLILETVNYQTEILENLTESRLGGTTVLKDDLQYLSPLTEFNGLLPKISIKEGDTWTIATPDFGRIIFRNDYDETKCSVKGKGTFEEIVDYSPAAEGEPPAPEGRGSPFGAGGSPEGRRPNGREEDQNIPCARISLELTIRHDETETTPQLETNLTGLCFCSLEQGIILSLELTGQFTLNKEMTKEDLTVEAATSGDIIIQKKVRMLK